MSALEDAGKWDAVYNAGNDGLPGPAAVLAENLHLLPTSGRALDLACGSGGNALTLARHGLDTIAWDFSTAAIKRLRTVATEQDLSVVAEVRNVLIEPPAPELFDVIVVSRFLERCIMNDIQASLRPQGLLYYQTFVRENVTERGPRNPAYRLAANELLRLFPTLRVLVYREEGRVGATQRGFRDEVMLVAQKAPSQHG